ncbi:hypothetical protein diail_5707 [Diaporthe ilicicola]|nr:hypothetical protein diail_5707 [Diaporthe ilicicola]
MGQLKARKFARHPPRLDRHTEIKAPSVGKELVNGKVKYTLNPAKAGTITILSDDEKPNCRSRIIKKEFRRTQHHEPLQRNKAHGKLNAPGDSSSSSDPSGSDSSDSSDSEDEPVSSLASSPSNGSSSGDKASPSAYRPSTPASSIDSLSPRTQQRGQAVIQIASANLGSSSPSRRSVQNDESLGHGHAPLDFFIDLPARPLLGRPEGGGRSISQASPTVAPTSSQADQTNQPTHQLPSNSSPVVLGFMAINRGIPPENAPTEPRAMRTCDARPEGASVRSPHRPSGSSSRPTPGLSSLPFRGLPPGKEKTKQKVQQRRGPARPGRTMQTIEHPSMAESPIVGSSPDHASPSFLLRPATPGPSSRRTAPPQPSPGIFVTPRSDSVRPQPLSEAGDSLRNVWRSRGKRARDDTEDTGSPSKHAEWKRMLERIRSHEKEMEQQRVQLEETKRLVAEQKTRIDDLEQQRRVEELIQGLEAQPRVEERAISPQPGAGPREVPQRRISKRQAKMREDLQRRRKESREARARLQEEDRQRREQERQEVLELEQQLAHEHEHEDAQRRQREARRLQDEIQEDPIQTQAQIQAQMRIQHEIFTRPLSGHNPKLIFDDSDRPHISEATAFLMRLSQEAILAKLHKFISGRAFFDVDGQARHTATGCWVVSRRACADQRVRLSDSGETHNFSLARLAVRLWHDEQSIYSLLQHHKHQQKSVRACHTDDCMHPDHIVVEPSAAAGERRACKRQGRCRGHVTVHKDGTRQRRRPCIFPPQVAFARR